MIPTLLHSFFSFLGRTEGELFKTVIELILFVILDYMIFSEWVRNKKRELRFLVIAFSVMVLQKVLSVYFLASTVFIKGEEYFEMVNNIGNFFEIFALFLIANAFVYPIIRQKRLNTTRFIKNKFLTLLPATFVLSIFVLSILDLKGSSMEEFWTNTAINVGEIVVLVYFSAYLTTNTKYQVKYRPNIIAALMIYSITPMIELFNIILYDNANRSLTVASHPFPFISVLIITQVIYLKLVDKATILDELKASEQRYLHEKELSKLKDEFISTVSHELRTPLTSMKLYVSFLKNKKLGAINKKQTDALNIIDEETNRLSKLITDILELNRFEANKIRIVPSTFDLYDIVANDLYLNLARNKGLNVIINVQKKFDVFADKDKIQQVFINLLNNSVKFTDKGTITISATINASDWSFSISDTGKGVKKELIPRLFDKFYQADNFMTRTQGGIGLGLAIVKSIVDLHKGKISVESEVGKGTTITIKIPKEFMY